MKLYHVACAVYMYIYLAALDPSCSRRDLQSSLEHVMDVQSPNHWTAREFPSLRSPVCACASVCLSSHKFRDIPVVSNFR